ncbi:hypothetical protein RP29_08235 [Acidovorax temperans]|uniref:Uncharacterized protein n=1 Tax=Acidovorax temperans TaxID=80878 RepID=A0A0D7KAG1_9BURK|nr:hypothetical protein RP29_08235 [Acidovorax temperans]
MRGSTRLVEASPSIEGLGAIAEARFSKKCVYIDKCFLCDDLFPRWNWAARFLDTKIEATFCDMPINKEAFCEAT